MSRGDSLIAHVSDLATWVLAGVAAGVVGAALTASYGNRSEAADIQTDFATDFAQLVSVATDNILLLYGNGSPEAYFALRCGVSLQAVRPNLLETERAYVQQRCLEARLDHVGEQKGLQNEASDQLLQLVALRTRARAVFVDPAIARAVKHTREALQALLVLAYDTCAAPRVSAAASLNENLRDVDLSHALLLVSTVDEVVPAGLGPDGVEHGAICEATPTDEGSRVVEAAVKELRSRTGDLSRTISDSGVRGREADFVSNLGDVGWPLIAPAVIAIIVFVWALFEDRAT